MSYQALKARQREAWDTAPWEPMAARLAAIHDHLVARLAPSRGERWLDVGGGSRVSRASIVSRVVMASRCSP
jgi:hypothetical protein